jgi:ADP-heptose:LPS heptosyltransferase
LPILSQKGAQFISLQYTPQEDEIAEFEKKHGIHIHTFPEAVYSSIYDDTAGLVANLDLVVTVATSVIHLAGSMGVPCWVLTASRAAWREYYGGETNPWYNSLRMFRQAHCSVDWEPPLKEVTAALAELLEAIHA